MIYGIMSLLPMPGFNAMAVNPVIQHSGAVIYPGSRLVRFPTQWPGAWGV